MEEDSYSYIFLFNICIISLLIFLLIHNLKSLILDSQLIYKLFILNKY